MSKPSLKQPPVETPRKPAPVPAASSESTTPSGWRMKVLIVLAFAAIYLIWGSTYLAIKLAIGTLPPFGMAATRFLIAGAILFTWASLSERKTESRDRRSRDNWRLAFIIGALLLLCGNGGVTWAERYLASGLAALFVATEPLWVVMLNWILGARLRGFAASLAERLCLSDSEEEILRLCRRRSLKELKRLTESQRLSAR